LPSPFGADACGSKNLLIGARLVASAGACGETTRDNRRSGGVAGQLLYFAPDGEIYADGSECAWK
jgi:hypothetical protein